ncbi:MAG: hypothetical protein KGI97_06180, partial [Alphaproteobacteria bacterium]|nr:hypothetical protein [Alphaproteobacteria bacterium]
SHYLMADKYMYACKPAAMRPAQIMRAYYGAIFDRLVAEGWRDTSRRIVLSKGEKIFLMLKGFFA